MTTGVRPYRPDDREAVRRICFETGYMGEPIAWQWSDPESFADLFSSWYTDQEPGSALVAVVDDVVLGYLLGCLDSRRVDLEPSLAAHHLLRRGLLVKPGTAAVLWRSLLDIGRSAVHRDLPRPVFLDDRWPAHLHIDLLPEGRGRGLGGELMRRWLATLRSDGVAGCHLETWAENSNAIAFFEAMGFERRGGPTPMPGIRSRSGGRHHLQLMVQSLGTGTER
jgi:ribosomal protein S18 acetylase RimI-like enzyme